MGIGTDGSISRIELDGAFADFMRKFYEDRTKRGIAAPGESPDVFNLIPEYNTPRRFKTLADDLSSRGWAVRSYRQDTRCEFRAIIPRSLDVLAGVVCVRRCLTVIDLRPTRAAKSTSLVSRYIGNLDTLAFGTASLFR